MIDLRMVADDRGNLQLQMRKAKFYVNAVGSLTEAKEWTPWQSVPIVHDPAQLVDRVEIFDAKSSGAKPDVGLTGKQLAEVLENLGKTRERYQDNAAKANRKSHKDFAEGVAAGIFECILQIQSVLGQQADQSTDDEFDPDLPY
jgi:hypothetical protein